MGRIPELIAAVRNRTLEYYEGDDRDLLASKYLLDNADSSEQAVRQARVRDEAQKHADNLLDVLPRIENRSPAVAQEVRPRFSTDEIAFYRTMLALWDALHRANEQVRRRRGSYSRALREYEARRRAVREPQRMKVLSPGEAGEGVRLVPREELLAAKDRMRLALRVSEVLAETERGGRFTQHPAGDDGVTQLSGDGYKQIAAGVAIATDQVLSLGNSDLQLAIEASAAANVGSVEAGLSRETRIGWGVALVREVHEDVGRIVGRLVSSLAYYHGMYVSDAAVQHLVDRFGAPEPLLRRYTADVGPRGVHGVPAGTDHLAHQFLEVAPLPRAYHTVLERMQRRIDSPQT